MSSRLRWFTLFLKGCQTFQLRLGECMALDAELKAEGRSYIAILERVGISGWRAAIQSIPQKPVVYYEKRNSNNRAQSSALFPLWCPAACGF